MNRLATQLFVPALAAVLTTLALPAAAHDGRRFQIEVVDGQLRTQGANSADSPIDPAGLRPYYGAIHGHWSEAGSFVSATLPGYDAGAGATALAGYDVALTLTGATKWTGVSDNLVDPTASGSMMAKIAGAQVKPGTTTDFQPLDGSEFIELNFGGAAGKTVSTADLTAPGADLTLTLIDNFDGLVSLDSNGLAQSPGVSNGYDLDLTYVYNGPAAPADTLYLLEAVLSTTAPGVADSTPYYTLISPDGSGPIERLHFASLFAEQSLGTPVPEPASAALLLIGAGLLARRRSA